MKPLQFKSFSILFLIITMLLTGCVSKKSATLTLSNQEALDHMQSEEVKSTLITMINAIDTKQWERAASQFVDDVFVDYSSLSGQPGAITPAAALVDGWKSLLNSVQTHHLLSNFDITLNNNEAEVFSHVYASHQADSIGYWDAYGQYHHKLRKVDGNWKITSMTLLMHGQKGNLNFIQEVLKMNETNAASALQPDDGSSKKVQFPSQGESVVGNLFFPEDYKVTKKYPAIIVSGSWTTVKEQMAGLYAKKLAKEGFITLAFDFRNFGESGGSPRFHENPARKVQDIKNAVVYLRSLPTVDGEKIGALGICAGAMYTLMAAADDQRIKSVVTVASWLHDGEAVKLFYGGADGVNEKIDAARMAKRKYDQVGEVDYIKSISTSDPSAAMFGPYDYYLNPERGAIPQWSADKFAVMSWEDWLTLDPMPTAALLTVPTLMIHSDGAVLPHYTKKYFENIGTTDKALYWLETELESPYHQLNFYDQEPEVSESIAQAKKWFATKL